MGGFVKILLSILRVCLFSKFHEGEGMELADRGDAPALVKEWTRCVRCRSLSMSVTSSTLTSFIYVLASGCLTRHCTLVRLKCEKAFYIGTNDWNYKAPVDSITMVTYKSKINI